MSGSLAVMALKEPDVAKFLAAKTHIGANNVNFQMEQYVFKTRSDGVNIINLRKTYEKLLLAARAVAAIENPADVFVISSRPMGQRAVLKFARYTGATPIAGRFTPGAFTNQIQAAFREPRLLVVTDPSSDHQPITEASYVNIPVIAFCNTDSPLRYVDVSIPCNNKAAHSVGLMWWLLAREVRHLRGSTSRTIPWEQEVMPDLFFYRDPEEQEKEEAQRAEMLKELEPPKPEPPPVTENWGGERTEEAPLASSTGAPVAAAPKEDWGQKMDEWTATPIAAGGEEWGGDTANWT